jgi:mannose-6-phosphate isomerase-like protein (cupin superfamily)
MRRHGTKTETLMKFVGDIEKLTEENADFRRVLYTAKHLQPVLMTLPPGEQIGEEIHADRDQFFRVEQGEEKSGSMVPRPESGRAWP